MSCGRLRAFTLGLRSSPMAEAMVVEKQVAVKSNLVDSKTFRDLVTNTLERRMFYGPSFRIYGGVAGLYDYGPPGCAVKANVLSYWRKHFVVEEDLLEVDCPCLTPEVVLKASGHVEKFTDLMVKDLKEGNCFRADHLLKDFIKDTLEKDKKISPEKRAELQHTLASLDDLTGDQLGAKIKEYGIKAPETQNDLSDPYPFNLMFATHIGPTGMLQGYLRPETAQGIFVNFKDLNYYNSGKLPFGAAQIGQAFRNEIAPRQGLLRVREFTLAEIEYFVDPEDKSHPKFESVAHLEFFLFPRDLQMTDQSAVKMRLDDAVKKGIVNNETLAYYIGRTYLFLTTMGIQEDRLRFRQHLANEMAHYAADCWDAEIECSYGWIECVGLADRSAYDLKAHTDASKVELTAFRELAEPKEIEEVSIVPNKKEIGIKFKAKQKMVLEALQAMTAEEASKMQEKLEAEGEVALVLCSSDETVTITKQMASLSRKVKKVSEVAFTPSVIEPSFGIGRIIYCLFEHCFRQRASKAGDEQFNVFHFPPLVAPIKCTVFPLVQKKALEDIAKRISNGLKAAGIVNKIDTTGRTIGKRYARTDEVGVPFAITVDFEDNGLSVTVRERDTRDQVRVPVDVVVELIGDLSEGRMTWDQVEARYPKHQSQSA